MSKVLHLLFIANYVRFTFNDEKEDVHDEPQYGRPSVITDNLMCTVDAKIQEGERFTILNLHLVIRTSTEIMQYLCVAFLLRRLISMANGL